MKLAVPRIAKIVITALLVFTGLSILVGLLDAALRHPPEKSDFAQDYFLAKAAVSGTDPYLPLNLLGEQFGIATQFNHPSPHPPSFVILSLPLALFSFQTAAFICLIVGLMCLLISLRLLFNLKSIELLIVFMAAIAWPPVWSNLFLGQSMLLQLLLLTLAWRALRTHSDLVGGLLLGLTISIKLIMWPLVLFLLIRKRFRAALQAVGFIAFLNLIALLLLGVHPVFTYYTQVGRQVAAIYSTHSGNFSAWSVGPRLFIGTNNLGSTSVDSAPLVNAPALAPITSKLSVVVIMIYGFFVALKARSFDTSFAVLVCTAIVVSPVSWTHYLVLLMPSLAILRRAADLRTRATLAFCLVAPMVSTFSFPFFDSPKSFAVGLLALFPLAAVLLLMAAHHSHQQARLVESTA
jgi:Glycosyltransferase family 87